MDVSEKTSEKRRKEDVEELREIFKAITDFVRELRQPLSELLESLVGSIRGDKVGEDVGKFYKSLKESGMSDEVAVELTKEYFRTRVSMASMLENILKKFSGPSREFPKVIIKREKEEEQKS